MIKLSDFVFKFFEEQGVSTAFMLAGGGIMHLVDSLGRSKIEYVCCHHEQACSIAAQSYSMSKNDLGLCLITTGPGGTNALTGLAASYVDSTPVIFISGQVKTSDFASLRGVRQFGAQENDIVSMAKPVSKYAVVVEKAEDILYVLQKAVYMAKSGRRGPVWIDIPLDIQAAQIDEKNLRQFIPEENKVRLEKNKIKEVFDELSKSKRPLFLVGHGLKASQSEQLFLNLQKKLKIPVVATWRELDLMDYDNEYFFGSPGLQANRFSNIITQGCDLLIVLGSRLDNMITAFNEEHFAYRAKRIIVDIDKNEIEKLNMPGKLIYHCDVHDFLDEMNNYIVNNSFEMSDITKWVDFCKEMKEKYPLENEKQAEESEYTDLYKLTLGVSNYCDKEDTIVASSTSRCNTAGHMAFYHKAGQKMISSMGMGSMGFALPSVVGAYFASDKNRVVMFEGDGSLQLNIQELQTIKYYDIDTKMFIFSNTGYAAIATMQDRNFNGYHVGSTNDSGISFPNLEKIANAYDIPYYKIETNDQIEDVVKEVMSKNGAVICEVIGSIKFDEIPKCISFVNENGQRESAKLENPFPFMDEKTLEEIYKKCLN